MGRNKMKDSFFGMTGVHIAVLGRRNGCGAIVFYDLEEAAFRAVFLCHSIQEGVC
jgi:hypothetical protein